MKNVETWLPHFILINIGSTECAKAIVGTVVSSTAQNWCIVLVSEVILEWNIEKPEDNELNLGVPVIRSVVT